MAYSFLTSLLDEIAFLERALEADSRYVKLRELRRVLRLYEQPKDSAPDQQVNTTSGVEPRSAAGRRPSAQNERVLQIARMFLANRGIQPVPTRTVLDHIEREGIQVGGEVPANTLSAMLSNSADFLSHGRAGWTAFKSLVDIVVSDLVEMSPREELRTAVESWDASRVIPRHFQIMLTEMAKERAQRPIEESQKEKMFQQFIEMSRLCLVEGIQARHLSIKTSK